MSMSDGYLTLVPNLGASDDGATARIDAVADRLRGMRVRLDTVAPALTELERTLAMTVEELDRARSQAAADRDSIARLEVALAERDAVRASVGARLAELGRRLETYVT